MVANRRRRALLGGLWPLLALPIVFALALACGGGGSTPDATATADSTTPVATAAPTATATPAPAWWEEETPSPTPDFPMTRVWNVRAEAVSPNEVSVTFDYHLDIAPEANVFVHMGLLPTIQLGLLDAAGETIEGAAGELDPTEFGDDTVGGQATFTFATTRFDEVEAVRVCIRVVTGNYDDFGGPTEIYCEPVPLVKVAR